MTERRSYGIAVAILLAAEAVIATCVHDDFVRPHVGDCLAVLLVYCTFRTATPLTISASIIAALLLAFAIEFGQLFGMLSMLGLENSTLARTVLGTGFDPRDFVAYVVGGGIAWVGEYGLRRAGIHGSGTIQHGDRRL